MNQHEYMVARAELRARGVARFRQFEHEAAAMLERGSQLTAAERKDYTAALHMARIFGRCLLIDADCLPAMMRHFVDMEIEKVGEA